MIIHTGNKTGAEGKKMTDRDYAFKSLKDIIYNLAGQSIAEADNKKEYEKKMKILMEAFQLLLLENKHIQKELESKCLSQINEDLSYVLEYMNQFNEDLDVTKLQKEMGNLILVYGLYDMLYRAEVLMRYYAPKGMALAELIRARYYSGIVKSDIDVMIEIGVGKTKYYRMKRDALAYMGTYFWNIVVKQLKNKNLFVDDIRNI